MNQIQAAPRPDKAAIVERETYPNFDFLRLLAASLVIFSHAFLIGNGSEADEPLVRLLGPHNICGIYSVHCFFIMSGFLVTQSISKSRSSLNFLWRRFLRIYPALLVCLMVCAIVIAPFFSTLSPVKFFEKIGWLKYVLRNILIPGQPWSIGSVKFYDDGGGWLGQVVNGSLWTIFHEVLCYLLIAVIAASGRLTTWLAGALAVGLALTGILNVAATSKMLSDFLFVAPGFFAGSALCLWSIQRIRRRALVVLALTLLATGLLVAFRLTLLMQIFPLLAAAPLLLLATSNRLRMPRLDRIGDISYGTYLYGWPVLQVVRSQLGAHASWLPEFTVSLVVTYLLGFVSWRVVEKPALQYKRWTLALIPPGRAIKATL